MRSTDHGHSAKEPRRTEAQEDRQTTVLVAEDDDALRETYRRWLEDDDWIEIQEASNGREALSTLSEAVDVVIIDRKMPVLSGPEVVDRLSDREFDGNLIVVSAFEPDTHLDEDVVTEYLTKPIDKPQLRDIVGRYG